MVNKIKNWMNSSNNLHSSEDIENYMKEKCDASLFTNNMTKESDKTPVQEENSL